MRSIADGSDRLLSWRRVREFAVPALMIETATARREAGDWAGACAAAHVDVDLDLRVAASGYGRAFAAAVRGDLRRLAPDLLRWHLPRTVPNGLLRPGLSMTLVRYPVGEHEIHLVARTAPGWASAGQRISLGLWDPGLPEIGPHPRPRPDRRFRLDLHPHLWAADRASELRERCGVPASDASSHLPAAAPSPGVNGLRAFHASAGNGQFGDVPAGRGYAVHRWVTEAAILRAADGYGGAVAVRLGTGRRLLLTGDDCVVARGGNGVPVLPHAATWMSPDLELLRAGMITAELLHPLVASALTAAGSVRGAGDPTRAAAVSGRGAGDPTRAAAGSGRGAGDLTETTAGDPAGMAVWDSREPGPDRATGVRLVECCGEVHRLGLVDGRLTPLDHDAEELRREELLTVFGGPPLPCLRAIDNSARQPECLDEVRTRLEHGDLAGATAMIVDLLGPGIEPEGALREALTDAEEGRIEHGLYRAGLAAQTPFGITGLTGPRRSRAGRRGRHHRLPKRAAAVR
jgi:hypothetical protein